MTVIEPIPLTIHVDVDQEMREAAQAFFAMTSSTPDAVFTKDLTGTILTWNRGAERLFGYLAADVVGQHISLLDPDPSGAEVASLLRLVASGDSVSGFETTRRRRDGRMVAVSLTISPMYDGRGEIVSVSVIGRDISDRKRLERQLERQSTYDDITGLPNRTLLDDRLGQGIARALRRGRPLAVVFVDVDRFREINATHGYVVGDQVLSEVAARLHSTVAMGDTLARFGGDEFVVISEETGPDDAQLLAASVVEALAAPMDISGLELCITASIGIAVSPPLVSILTPYCATRRQRCTTRSSPVAASGAFSTRPAKSCGRHAAISAVISAPRWPTMISGCTTNPSLSSRPVACSVSKRWCGGSTPPVAGCHPRCSCRSRRKPG